MNRRDFLLFRTRKKERIVELSCERLYMQHLDIAAGAARASAHAQPLEAPFWSEGEPPLLIDQPTSEEFFQDLQCELLNADVVRIRDSHWLVGEEIRRSLDDVLAVVRAAGRPIEFCDVKEKVEPSKLAGSPTRGEK